MPYVGKTPVVGNFVKLDTITTSATATYNLLNGGVAYSPQSANHCIVSLNGVIQSPTTSFTISGSTIVFASALTSSDVIDFILVLGDVLNIGTPSDATVGFAKVTSNLITGATAETTIAGGDSILIYDDSASALRKMTRTNFVAGVGGTNTPAFSVTTTSAVTVGGGASTKITWNTEYFDTDNAFDSTTNYRFTVPTGKAGKYMFHASNGVFGSISGRTSQMRFYKNGVFDDTLTYNVATFGTTHVALIATVMFNLSAGDYIETYIYSDNDAPKNTVDNNDGSGCQWFGYRLVE